MNKFIIGFFGASNNGKTSSLKALISLFDKECEITDYPSNSSKDKVVTFNYNGIKIGIATGGDVGKIVSRNLKLLTKENCDIIVTACRTQGKTNDVINEYQKTHCIRYITCPHLSTGGEELSKEDIENLNIPRAEFVKSYIDSLIK